MIIKIINHNSGILIGGKNYPKNFISIGLEGNDAIKITGPDGNIVLAAYDNFRNEFNEKYDTAIAVIEDLGRSLGGDPSLANKLLIDEVVGGLITYVGYAAPGSLTSEPKWMIQKITSTATSAPSQTKIEWSVARNDKTSIWENRATTVVYVS